jgi:hypothetical protein
MSDAPRRRSRAWIWWAPLVAVLLYVVSIVPVAIVAAWMAHFGLVSDKHAGDFLSTVFAPIEWASDHSESVQRVFNQVGKQVQPLFPSR